MSLIIPFFLSFKYDLLIEFVDSNKTSSICESTSSMSIFKFVISYLIFFFFKWTKNCCKDHNIH